MDQTRQIESRVRQCITEAIAEVNTLRPADAQVAVDPDAVLIGDAGQLDSLGVVNFAVALEAQLEREFGRATGLVGEILGATDPETFRTVALMEAFVSERVERSAG